MTALPKWRVVLLEDDPATRRFFEACVAGHAQLRLVGSFASLAEAREWFARGSADILLTDLSLPDGHALDLIRQVVRGHPGCDVLVVSVFGDEDTVLACVEAGALGYIHKDSSPRDVADVILDVKRGASPISPMIARKILERVRHAAGPAAPVPAGEPVVLTPREADVLELVSRGYSYAEIARLQMLSIHTVQSHIKNLYAKLAVHSRSEAVFEASRMGLLGTLRRER
jgi:DNA-binding NarL/FixJ family response regulator